MADFIMNSICGGCKPKHLRGRRIHQRAGLVSRMMQKRDAVRFLIAPSGFGKTALAAEYAESIFAFQNVFWLNAQSPCFLRDVDKGTLGPSLASHANASSLVVIEDLPQLAALRAESVSSCIDGLLDQGFEVIVTTVPPNGGFADKQPDGVIVCSRDFLVSREELGAIESSFSDASCDARALLPAGGVPGLLWGGSQAPLDMLKGIVADAPPSDVLFALFVLVSLGGGSLEDVEAFSGPLKSDTRATLEKDYLFAGIDGHRERFESYPFPIEDIVCAFSGPLARMAAASGFADANALAARLADAMLSQGECERACSFVDRCCTADRRMSWLSSRSSELIETGCLLAAHDLFESRAVRLGARTPLELAQEAWRLVCLGDAPAALKLADRAFCCADAADSVRGAAALVMARFGDADARLRALSALRALASAGSDGSDGEKGEAVVRALRDKGRRWAALASACVWLDEGERAAVRLCDACASHEGVGAAETGMLLWSVEVLGKMGPRDLGSPHASEVERALFAVGDYLQRCEREGAFGFWEAVLLDAWDQARAGANDAASHPSLTEARASARASRLWLLAQRASFEKRRHAPDRAPKAPIRGTGEGRASASTAIAKRPSDRRSSSACGGPPGLFIRLFGGLEASIGDKLVDPALFRRQKVKALLALLTLNQGKELLRERLSAMLWPSSSAATAQRNFYSTWSLLRKALSLPGGECPYLIRLQYGCKLDSRTVVSDVAEFDALCNRLLFDPPDVEVWSGIYSRLDELYRGDLLPSESRNEYIVRQREEYRSRLIDALVAASARLFEQGKVPAALWFAHAAVRKDETREDAYTVLMQAQIASGQRTAALDTFFACKRYLSDELGIDPSPRTLMLYGSIIEEEPGLKTFVSKSR